MNKIVLKHIHEEFWLKKIKGYGIYHRYDKCGEITWCINYGGSAILFIKHKHNEQWYKVVYQKTEIEMVNTPFDEVECNVPKLEVEYLECKKLC